MKKRSIFEHVFFIAIIVVLFMMSISYAANETNGSLFNVSPSSTSSSTSNAPIYSNAPTTDEQKNAIERGYTCLDNQVKNKSVGSLSLQEAVFATLAVGNKKNLQNKLESEKNTAGCWPKSACTIKDSAQVLLAYQRSGKTSSEMQKWLLSKNATSTDLNWYLEIDSVNRLATECTLKYDGSDKKIKILDDQRITGNPGNCLSIGQNGYWLLVRENCYDKEIQVSCSEDFISTLIYEKKGGTTIYVLPDTHSAAALGATSEKVSVKCLKSGTGCDYEGTLWAILALHKSGVNVDNFVPYLIAMAENNRKYFPGAFLYSLTGANDQYSDIIQSQKQSRSWKIIGSPYNEFYDTSLAMLALTKSSSIELDNAKNYLLSIQGKDGCWNNGNIRDTGFILYSGWSKNVPTSSGGDEALCELVQGQSCESSGACLDAGGRVLSNFQCSGFSVCCSVKVQLQTCSAQRGALCTSDQQCDGNAVPSSDSGTCCVGACVAKEQENTCELFGSGTCKNSCANGEQESSDFTCSGSSLCCVTKESSGISGWFIALLIILIILIILAIIFRNKLKIWWFKFKGKIKTTPVVKPSVGQNTYRAPMHPAPANQFRRSIQPITRPAQQQRPQPRKPISDKDKEMEETLRKLREMSK